MPWKEKGLETMRAEFVERVLAKEKSKAALCREYGISRPTGDKWINRYLNGASLANSSRAPVTQYARIPDETEAMIVDYRTKYPAIGALKLRRILENKGITNLPCAKTFNNVFKRNGLITKEASQSAKPCKRFEKKQPNDMWQSDYKGHFPLQDKTECHTLNIIDDCSRYNLCCKPMYGETFDEIKPVITRLFYEYGLPFSWLCDNGNPWGTSQSFGYTRFEVWLMELGVLTLHGRARHPQTQGKDESFNRSFTREELLYYTPKDMEDASIRFEKYRNFYNNIRPHHALGLDVPSSRYKPSNRKMPKKITCWEYASDCMVRKVKSTGYFNYNNQGLFLSEAFAGKDIAIKKANSLGHINLFFRQFFIGRINLIQRVYTSKTAYLLKGDPRME